MTAQVTPFFDRELLVAAISQEQPCGTDTRQDDSPDSPYYTLKDLRQQARAAERQVLTDEEAVRIPQWRQLADAIPPVLSDTSKDLELVAWLIEALCREHGFEGLTQGFSLATELIQRHWDHLYPSPDEEGVATRMAPLVGLNGLEGEGTLIGPILSIPLFQSPSLGNYATWHAEQAAEVRRLDEKRASQRLDSGAASPADLDQAVGETDTAILLATDRAIAEAERAFRELTEAMDQVMDEPQPTTRIARALERCRSTLAHHAGDRIEQAAAARDAAEAPETREESPMNDTSGNDDPQNLADPVQVAIRSRHDAIEQLRRLADFFRQTEPHSPVSYAIDQAIRWSELPLPELMQELIADNNAREGFCRVTGVPADANGQ